jgi:PAS domain S-box-containing protein
MGTVNPLNRWRTLLTPPHFKDEQKNQQAFILNIILWSLIFLAFLYLLFSLIFSPQTAGEDILISSGGILISIFLLALMRRGYVRQASIIHVASFWLLFTGISLTINGILGPAYMTGYLLVILISGILLEGRGALVTTTASLLAGIGIFYVQKNALVPFNNEIPMIGYWVISAFMFPLCAILQYLAAAKMRQALARASQSEAAYRVLFTELKESEERYRTLVEAFPDLILVQKLTGEIIYANPALQKQEGMTLEELQRVGGGSLIHPDDRNYVRTIFQELIKSDQQYSDIIENRIIKDGKVYWRSGVVCKIQYQGIPALLGISRDITQRKHVEEQLSQAREFTDAVLDSVPGLLYLLDESGRLIRWNKQSEAFTGYTPEDMSRMSVVDFFDGQTDIANIPAIIRDTFTKGRAEMEANIITKQGKSIPFYLTGVSLNISGKPYLTGIGIDITARKAAEAELRRLNRALRTISKCNETLVRSVSEEDLLSGICQNIVEVGQYQLACIHLVGSDTAGSNPPGFYYCHEQSEALQSSEPEIIDAWKDTSAMLHMVTSDRQSYFVNKLSDLQHNEQIKLLLRTDRYRSLAVVPLGHENEIFGVLSIFSTQEHAFDEDEVNLITEMASDLAYGIHTHRVRSDRKTFLDRLEVTNQELEHSYDATLEGWSYALELREHETAGHSQRVVELTLDIARSLGIPINQLIHIQRGAILHDIGKMGIPDSILLKPGPLTEDEWRTMHHHPVYAYRLLKGIPYLEQALDIPYQHHERWDGLGYPNQLAGEQIPLAARIFAVVDVWDALTSNRPYRLAWTEEEALRYIREQSGKQFDPRVVRQFMEIVNRSR